MNFAQENQAGSRMTSFGIVVLLHVVMIWALASGLARKVVEAVKGPIETKVIEEVKPPPPEEKIVPPPPDLKAPPPPFVPPPEFVTQAPPPPTAIQTQSSTPPPVTDVRPAPPPQPAPPAPAARPAGPIQAGVVCTKMPKPEITTDLATPFEANVHITLRGGKVVAKEFQVTRSLSDKRAQRAIVNAISASVDEYQCGTYDGQVVQPFLVNPAD